MNIMSIQIIFSDKRRPKKWAMLIIYWVVWIIIILSARYIWNVIFEEMLQSEMLQIKLVDLAQTLYKIAYPFIKIILYLLYELFLIL